MSAISIRCAAWSNDSAAMIAYWPSAPIPGCLGFSIHRIEVNADGSDGTRTPIKSRLPFQGQDNEKWEAKSTDEWPIQKFLWRDFEAPRDKHYVYEIIPMSGEPGKLVAMKELAVRTNKVAISTKCGDYFETCFTHGILSTQRNSHKLEKDENGVPKAESIIKAITTPGDPFRQAQAGRMIDMILKLHREAKAEGGHMFDALYEFSDPELVQWTLDNPTVVSLILSNTGEEDETNGPHRAKLHAAGVDVHDRFLPNGSIGHNKLRIKVNKAGEAEAVGLGSTNSTPTGLCTQTNNHTIVRYPPLARDMLGYWHRLKDDTLKKGLQSAAFRAQNAKGRVEHKLPDGTRIIAWISPNMPEREKPKTGAPTPPDMGELFGLMDGVKEQLMFLAFYPGAPSIVTKVADMNKSRRELFIRGAVSSPQALPRTRLYHRKGEPPVIVAASALEKEIGDFEKELLKLPDAHAVIHDKVVVGDPLDPENCFVCFGSHNLGFKASYGNDEVMFIVIGGKSGQALVQAYMVHILDVYDHYRFRWIQNGGKSKFTGFLNPTAAWQDRHFNTPLIRREMEMWTKDRTR